MSNARKVRIETWEYWGEKNGEIIKVYDQGSYEVGEILGEESRRYSIRILVSTEET